MTTNILKMDENSQYDQAMTKPLPYGCIKKMKTSILLEFNRILDALSHDRHIRDCKTMLFNEISTSGLVLGLDKNDPIYEARKRWYENKREEDLDSIHSLEARLKRNGKKKKFHDIEEKIEEADIRYAGDVPFSRQKSAANLRKVHDRESSHLPRFHRYRKNHS